MFWVNDCYFMLMVYLAQLDDVRVSSNEITHINYMDIGLTWPWFEPTMDLYWGEHANNYTASTIESIEFFIGFLK